MFGGDKLSIERGNNNNQVINEGTLNLYTNLVSQESIDLGIITEILEYVIENSQSKMNQREKAKPEKLLKAETKIKRNFKKASDKKVVGNLYLFALQKTALIEEKFSQLDSNNQADIHSSIYSKYIENKSRNMSSMENLKNLISCYIPKGKENNPHYENCAKAFVLFFFGDCTIFEKTKDEKAYTPNLFSL